MSLSGRFSGGSAEPGSLLPPIAVPVSLVALGALSLWLYYWGQDLHRFTQGIAAYIWLYIAQFAMYLAACYIVMLGSARDARAIKLATLAIIILFAAGSRAQLVDERPYLSTDTYRYIWDGRVQAAGINPYRHIPSAPELAHLRDDSIYPKINRSDYAQTPYPPIAQAIYLLVYLSKPFSVTAFKLAMSLFDIITVIAIMITMQRAAMNPARAIIFAWHPLLIFEGAHTGHVESAFVSFLALGLLAWSYKKHALIGVAIGLAAMVKFYPALVLPAFITIEPYRDSGYRAEGGLKSGLVYAVGRALLSRSTIHLIGGFVATILLAYLPYLSVGARVIASLPNELKEEGFVDSGGRYFLLVLIRKLVWMPTEVFLMLAALVLLGLGAWWLVKAKHTALDVARGAIALIGLYLILTTPRYPWYYAWIIPFLCLAPRTSWLYLTGASVLLYLLWYTPHEYPALPLWLGTVLYAPTVALLGWERWQRSKQEPDVTNQATGEGGEHGQQDRASLNDI